MGKSRSVLNFTKFEKESPFRATLNLQSTSERRRTRLPPFSDSSDGLSGFGPNPHSERSTALTSDLTLKTPQWSGHAIPIRTATS
jgi:hypothetical protein